jgi:pyruvate,water dikinase
MIEAGFPVAPGFTVSTQAYRDFAADCDLRRVVDRALANANPASSEDMQRAEKIVREHIEASALRPVLVQEIEQQYEALASAIGIAGVSVAVRSSASVEDSASASFAGEFETYVDICGAASVVEHVRRCWQSVFGSRALRYALEHGIDPHAIEMAVIVQKTVRARVAGVMFTLSPVTGDRSRIVLEASWGLGLSIVGGEVTPDRYVVEKIGLRVCDRVPGDKRIEYVRGDAFVPVAEERWTQFCLTDAEVTALAALGKKLERLKGNAQDIEFAIDAELPEGQNLILLQCRPETVWSVRERKPAFETGTGVLSWIAGSVGGRSKPQSLDCPDSVHVHG